MGLNPNTKLGPYEIIAPLGAGGMGEVYRAKDTRLDREVAIKVLPERVADDADALARFEREGKAVAALSHPNILAIFDVGSQNAISYVVTELLEGETLRERLRRSAIPWRKAVEIGIEIAEGLSAAHSKGVIHRDLKPENLFITTAGHMKILDFGLARVAPGAAVPAELQANTPTMTLDTRPGTVLGTVHYMSPEQISGRMTDARTDIFSFGCVLYEMISGHRAFGGESVAEITTAILRDEPPTLADSGRVVPVELDRAIARCHEKKPEQRIQSARDLSFALRDLLSDSVLPKRGAAHVERRARTALVVPLTLAAVVLAGLLLTLNVGGWRERLFSRSQVSAGAISSLAVLPLENVSRDPEQEYFVDGMTEALISDLAKIGSLKVISRTSVMRYKATTKSLPEIARELNVDAVVEGSVLRVGERVRITAQLIHAATDEHLWAESYDRDLRDVLRLQSEVARTIAQEIKVTLTPQEHARMVAARPINPEAYQAYLKGRFHWNKRTSDGLQKAIDYFEQAVSLAPDWPLAHVGLAEAYSVLPDYSSVRSSEAIPKARATVAKALQLDESLGEAHVTMAAIASEYDWDWATSEREFQRAITLSPNYATAHHWYARHLMFTGRHAEAMREIKIAQELDPLSTAISASVGLASFHAGDFVQAETGLRKTLEFDPTSAMVHMLLARTLLMQDRREEGIAEARKAVQLSESGVWSVSTLGFVCAKGGKPQETRSILEEFSARSKEAHIAPIHFAVVYAGLGETDRVIDWLEKAHKDGDTILWVMANPMFADVRADPRFADLFRRVGLPPLPAPPGRDLPASPIDKGGPRTVTDAKIMLAVLPFENLSRDPQQEFFSDGLTEEMITQLGRLNPQALGVIARSSAMHYKNTDRTIEQVRRELGVDYVVEGSVRRAGNRVRITATLIQCSDQSQLWTNTFERELADVLGVQSEVAQAIAGEIKVKLTPHEQARIVEARLIDPEAYQAYLKGRFYWNKRTPDGLKKAVEYFEQAVSLAPDWPLGYVGLADAYVLMPYSSSMRPSEAIPKARAAAAKALEMDESLGEAHASLGYVAIAYDWNWATAEREFQRSLALGSNYATAHHWNALYLLRMGRHDQAIREITKAQELDPLALTVGAGVGMVYYYAGDFEKAEVQLRKTLELGPDFPTARLILAQTLCQQRRLEEAITEARALVKLSNDNPHSAAVLGYMCARAGQPEDARTILKKFAARSTEAYVAPTHFALLYAGLDERDQMFDWLERAYRERDVFLSGTLIDPLLVSMRSDPRFTDLVRRVGLPPLTPMDQSTIKPTP